MTDSKALYAASLCAAASLGLIWNWRRSKSKFPPGPTGLPVLGNLLDVPSDVPIWQTCASMAQKFDTDVLHLKLLNTDIVVLSSRDSIVELFEKRSSIYSERPPNPMLDLMGHYNWNIEFMDYGNQWRNNRRLLHEFLGPKGIPNFDDYQRKNAYRFLSYLADSPENFLDDIDFVFSALVMEMSYGLDITDREDRFLKATGDVVELMNKAVVPGSFLVNALPMLRYVPEWFPGAGFKAFARGALEKSYVALNGPLEYVKERVKAGGDSNASIAWSCFDRLLGSSDQKFDENSVRAVTATMYTAAVGAMTSVLQTFFLAMALNPHVVKKAQEELDRVVGDGRLPDFSDQEGLPYISALIKELLRWGCPPPIGSPRRVERDDVYNGHFIPAGATVIENLWAICYDESIYPEPTKYDPERYLKNGQPDSTVKDPEERIFGSGRRHCPGKYLAMRIIYLNVTCFLSLFDIEAPVGEKLEAKFPDDGFIRRPAPFKCTIKPRSEVSLNLLRSSLAAEMDKAGE